MLPQKFQEIINFALDNEKEAVSFYQTCSQKVSRQEMKEAFMQMAQEEQEHIRKLNNFDPDRIEESELHKIPNLRIGEYMVDMEFRPNMGYAELLVLAIKKEEKAYNLYSLLAKQAPNHSVMNLFNLLAQEELKHKLRLEKEYDEEVLKEN